MMAQDQVVGLRPLVQSDAQPAAGLHDRAMTGAWSAKSWASLLADPLVFGFACELDGELVAVSLARAVADEAEILVIAVAPEARCRGIGRSLVKAVLDEAHRRGAKRVYLEVAATNEPALELYRDFGFVDAGRRSGYYNVGGVGDALILARGAAMDAAQRRS